MSFIYYCFGGPSLLSIGWLWSNFDFGYEWYKTDTATLEFLLPPCWTQHKRSMTMRKRVFGKLWYQVQSIDWKPKHLSLLLLLLWTSWRRAITPPELLFCLYRLSKRATLSSHPPLADRSPLGYAVVFGVISNLVFIVSSLWVPYYNDSTR